MGDNVSKRVLVKNGYIYKGWHEGWYSVADETFYTDAQVEPSKDPATGNLIMVFSSQLHILCNLGFHGDRKSC